MNLNELYAGDTLVRVFTFKNEDDELFEPTTITIDIIDPSGTGLTEPLEIEDLIYVGVGTYRLVYNLNAEAEAGVWKIEVTATYAEGSLQNKEVFSFVVID